MLAKRLVSLVILLSFITLLPGQPETAQGPKWAGLVDTGVAAPMPAGQARSFDVAVVPAGFGLPNLAPLQQEGWDSALVISTVADTNTDAATVDATQTLFIDWTVFNFGDATSDVFQIDLVLDGFVVMSWISPELPPLGGVEVLDFQLGPLPEGLHSLALLIDSTDEVFESDEDDNILERSVLVSTGGAPNLRPFQPDGWDAPLVVSREAGTRRDSAMLTAAEPLFIDWAVLNNGTAATGDTFFTTLFVDGVEVGQWFSDPPLQPNFFFFVEDFRIGPLAAGTHTLRLLADSSGDIDEGNESDNEYVRQIEIAPAGGGQADEIFFIFPSVESGSGRDTGIAIANPTETDANVDLFLLNDGGEALQAAIMVVPADGQVAMVLTQIFSAARPRANAWILARSENLGLAAFFLTFSGGARNIDGAEAAVGGGGFLVFPEIYSGDADFTEINLVGSGGVDLQLWSAAGNLLETVRVQLPTESLGRVKREVSELFNVPIPDASYVVAWPLTNNVVGYETFGSDGFLGGRNAIRSSDFARPIPSALFGAQLAEVSALESLITLVNPTGTPANIRLRAFATGVAGAAAADLRMTLQPRSMLRRKARELLGLREFVGWLRVDSDISGVVGDISFGDPNGQYLASVQLQRTPSRKIVASHVADGLGFFTGLTFLNPTVDPANVEVEVFNTQGQRTGRGEFVLQPFEHRPRVLSQIIPGFPAQVGGYIRVTAEPAIFAFELFSRIDRGRLLSLAAVPPQRGYGVIEGRVSPVGAAGGRAEAEKQLYPASWAKGLQLGPESDFVPGEVVVKMAPGTAAADLAWLAAEGLEERIEGGDGVSLFRGSRASGKSGFSFLGKGNELAAAKRDTLELVERLNQDPRVLYAEPNYIYRPSRVPNDAGFNLQWHYLAMKLPQAWDITVGNVDIVVAIIDSGAKFNHPDLGPRLTAGQMDFISDVVNALDGDGIDGDADDPGDDPNRLTSSYHGTHVAGTVGAVTNNGAGVAGVNWLSPLMTLRVLGAQGGSNFDIAQAVRYSARLSNSSGQLPTLRANVVNMSLGGFSRSQTLADAVAAAQGQNVLIVAAAGNATTDRQAYPAGFDGVVSVGATDQSGGRAPYSNFGPRIDVVATGGNTGEDRDGNGFVDGVLSTLWQQSDDTPNFVFYQGTSMASPHVAGIASLMLSVNPNLTPVQLRQILRATAIDLGVPGFDNTYGAGLADPVAALRAAGGQPPANPSLVLSTTSLDFGTERTQINVVASNGGGGMLQLSAPTVQTDAGGGWLSASLSGNTIFAQVNRAGLANGAYTGRIRVNSNGGTGTIQVAMAVGAAAGVDPGTIFVLALDPFTFETELTVATDAEADFRFRILPLPAGDYVIAAGTDNDDDGFICDEGELCGLFPVSNEPVAVAVEGNQTTSGVDFNVEAIQLPTAAGGSAVPASGFRIRP